MTDDIGGFGRAPAGDRNSPQGPGMSIAARAQPAVDQPFDGDSLYAVRATVAAHASAAGIPASRIRDVVLAVHELAANAVRHGAGQGRMRLWITGDGIRCEVADAGAGASEVADAGARPSGPHGDGADAGSHDAARWPVEQGHGLWLVRKVADQASLDTGPSGTVAVIDFRFESARATS
jgi:anti-sigma regulatory factor (Ser/Thr protein kinase)